VGVCCPCVVFVGGMCGSVFGVGGSLVGFYGSCVCGPRVKVEGFVTLCETCADGLREHVGLVSMYECSPGSFGESYKTLICFELARWGR
jgi:hypothetical protein